MSSLLLRLSVVPLCMITLVSVGCSRSYKAEHELKPTGFLSSYEGLEPNKFGNYQFKNDSVKLTDYDAFIIEPVVVKLPAGSTAPADVQAKAKRYMEAAIQNAVGEYYPIVSKPGAGVARWRTAIVDIRPSGEGNGGAAAEVEIVDSVSGERLTAVVANNDAQGDPSDNSTVWHDAKAVMDVWTGRVRAAFDKAHGVKPSLMPAK